MVDLDNASMCGIHNCSGFRQVFASGEHKHDIVVQDDPVNHPKHYTNHPSGIECIEIVRHMSFNRGNAIKYIWRAGEKNDEIEDLEKAQWYLGDEIQRLKDERSRPKTE